LQKAQRQKIAGGGRGITEGDGLAVQIPQRLDGAIRGDEDDSMVLQLVSDVGHCQGPHLHLAGRDSVRERTKVRHVYLPRAQGLHLTNRASRQMSGRIIDGARGMRQGVRVTGRVQVMRVDLRGDVWVRTRWRRTALEQTRAARRRWFSQRRTQRYRDMAPPKK